MSSSKHRLKVSCLIIHTLMVLKVRSSYDCRRESITCENSGTCGSDGRCTGCPDFQGYDCALPSDDIGENDCPNSNHCHNGAICYDDHKDGLSAKVNCHCLEQHTGEQCTQARYTVRCTDTTMDVSITPYSGSSAVYHKDKHRVCDLSESSGTWVRTGMQHSGDTSCGSADIDLSQTETTYVRKFIVQDLSDKITDADFVVTAVCSQGSTIGTATTSKLNVIPYVGEVRIESQVGDVTLTHIDPTGAIRNIGEVVTFTFTADDDLEEIRLDTVVASDNVADSQKYTLISAGCRETGSDAIVVTNPAHPDDDKKVIEVKLAIFLFNSNPSLKLFFVFKTYLVGDVVGCAPMTCSGKRKRDVSHSAFSNESSVVEVTFIIHEDMSTNKGDVTRGSSDERRHCADCHDVILPVVTAGIGLFIAALFVCLLFVCVKKLRTRRKGINDGFSKRESGRTSC